MSALFGHHVYKWCYPIYTAIQNSIVHDTTASEWQQLDGVRLDKETVFINTS